MMVGKGVAMKSELVRKKVQQGLSVEQARAEVKSLPPALKEQFLDLACALSPENLTCDGELPKSLVIKRFKALKAKWRALEKVAGRPVSESEVF
jgi:hypothetical protein